MSRRIAAYIRSIRGCGESLQLQLGCRANLRYLERAEVISDNLINFV